MQSLSWGEELLK